MKSKNTRIFSSLPDSIKSEDKGLGRLDHRGRGKKQNKVDKLQPKVGSGLLPTLVLTTNKG